VSFCKTFLDHDVLAFDIAERGHPLEKGRPCFHEFRIAHGLAPNKANAWGLFIVRLLRELSAVKERPLLARLQNSAGDPNRLSRRRRTGGSTVINSQRSAIGGLIATASRHPCHLGTR